MTLPLRHDDIIRQQADEKDLDPALIAAVIYEESSFRDKTSHAGARGLMQMTPATAIAIAEQSGGTAFVVEDLADPHINIRYGTSTSATCSTTTTATWSRRSPPTTPAAATSTTGAGRS